jgi:predicted Zn-dependent protease
LSRNRIDALRQNVGYETAGGVPYPVKWDEEHTRMKAKLIGFLRPQQVSWHFSEKDSSIPALYARAIAAYRQDHTGEALDLIDRLLAAEPANPWFLELKAQMLKDFGRLGEARPMYEAALRHSGEAPLIEIDLAHVLIETAGKDEKALNRAIDLLNRASVTERRSIKVRRLLATAYGRLGKESQARLQLAEEALLQGKMDYAKQLAEGAKKNLDPKSREYRRASDILNFIEQDEKETR